MNETSHIEPESADYAASVHLNGNNAKQYQRIFWGGYKHHVRALLTGVSLGAVTGAAVGTIALILFPPLGLLGIAAFAGAGSLIGVEQLSSIGTASGSRAASLAEVHASTLDPANEGKKEKIIKDSLMDFDDHHYEADGTTKKNKWFQWKSGLTGTAIGGAVGALVGSILLIKSFAVDIPLITMLAHAGIFAAIGASTPALAPILAGALVFGMLGLTFGIDRGIFKSVFNNIDSFLNGKKNNGREQFIGHETGTELKNHRLEREKVIDKLHKKYDEKIFMGGIKGYLQGATGGALIGLVAGALVGGIIALLAPAIAIPVIAGFMTAGIAFGVKTFSEAGYNAGVESTTRAIDDEFHLRQAQKAKGILTEPEENITTEPKMLSGKLFDGALGIIGAVSNTSKKIYNNVYAGNTNNDPDMPHVAQRQNSYYDQITPEETSELNRKLARNKKYTDYRPVNVFGTATIKTPDEPKNFADTITQQKARQFPAAIQ